MSGNTRELEGSTRRVIVAQVGVGALIAAALTVWPGFLFAASFFCGVLVGTMVTLLLSRSVRKAAEIAATDPKRGMLVLYVGAVQRFLFVIAAFALGLAVFSLEPLAMAAGFIAAQFAQLVNARSLKTGNDDKGLK